MMRYLTGLLLLLAAASCSSDSKNIPAALGLPGDVYIVMDSISWKGPLGTALDSLLTADVPYLPRKEPLFKTRWIDPRKLNGALKQRRNLIFVLTLDRLQTGGNVVKNLFTPASVAQIAAEPDRFNRTASDVFARGQEVLYLYNATEGRLLQQVRKNGGTLVQYFNQKERERLSRSLFKAGEMKGITDGLKKEMKCEMRFPFGYKIAEKDSSFIWLRQINPRDDKDIFIARKPYVSQADFRQENLIAFRDAVCKKHLYGDPDRADSYIITERRPFIPVTSDTVNFNGHFGVQLAGLYRSNDFLFGGPFMGFAVVDEAAGQFYYIEGFTISPGRDQREIMRELETILYTFRTSSELTAPH